MNDELVLNLAAEEQVALGPITSRKGGRWTDRLKAKRLLKRKLRSDEKSSPHIEVPDVDQRPEKKPRKEGESSSSSQPTQIRSTSSSRRPTHIISSLFSYNPKIDLPLQTTPQKYSGRPSNAPLGSSTFVDLSLDPLLVAHLTTKMKVTKPTPIQRSALLAILPTLSTPDEHRDVFIQSQTGSGKTLSFLLPVIQDLFSLSSLSYIDRSIGTLAIIIAPTRELAKQISDVLESLLRLRLRPEDEGPEESTERLTRWLVSGLLSGGSTRTHEKARLRKGIPILVSTPGRLLDHLQNTSSFNVAKCRWLILDEADRLMDLGFEDTIKGIITALEGRRNIALTAPQGAGSIEIGGWEWGRRRRTILCSATLGEDVQKLAGTALVNPLIVKATELEKPLSHEPLKENDTFSKTENLTPPSQLAQKYVVVPLKLRLVTLVALLRSLITQSGSRRNTKIIVFLSCTDSVDFHWHLFGSSSMDDRKEVTEQQITSDDDEKVEEKDVSGVDRIKVESSLLPGTSIYRLHGSLATPTRLASLRGFTGSASSKKTPKDPSSSAILLCTSVASRGLDLPFVRAVIQYDLPTEGGAVEYVHRVGRTARAGKGGEAWSIIAPSEIEWVKWVEERMYASKGHQDSEQNIGLTAVSIEEILRPGFGGKGTEYESRATDVQLSFERWVLQNAENMAFARRAYLSHMRAYATHPANEKHIFHIRQLHLGHLAKSFALREAPKSAGIGAGSSMPPKKSQGQHTKGKERLSKKAEKLRVDRSEATGRRMQKLVRAQGRLTKKGGVMMSTGISEFQIANSDTLKNI